MAVLILGAGPAGISASLYTIRGGIETRVITEGAGSLERAERIENYYGAGPKSGRELYETGRAQAESLGVDVTEGEALDLSFEDKFKISVSGGGVYYAESVVIATGMPRRTPKIGGIARFEGAGVSRCAVCDAFFYRKKRVAVLGGGEYAAHEAEELIHTAVAVYILTNGEEPSAAFPEGVEIITKKVASLEGGDRLEKVAFGDKSALDIDGLFIALGTAGSAELAAKVGAPAEDGYIGVDADMSTGVPGLFAAGDCVSVLGRKALPQVSAAVYTGAVAGMSAVKYCRSIKR